MIFILFGIETDSMKESKEYARKVKIAEQKRKAEKEKREKTQRLAQLLVLQNYINKNIETGFIKKINVDLNEVYINIALWRMINIDVKKIFTTNLAKYCELKGSTGRITVKDYISGKNLASYGSWGGFKVY